MSEHKQSYFTTISTVMTASGKFTHRIDCPFSPTHVIVHSVMYDSEGDFVIIKSPFVQGGVVALFNSAVTIHPKTKMKCVGSMRGEFSFECRNANGTMNVGMDTNELAIMFEFVA